MAEFCNQCCVDMGFPPGELGGISKKEDTDAGKYPVVICEGCGIVQVDHEGNCVSSDCICKHGKANLNG